MINKFIDKRIQLTSPLYFRKLREKDQFDQYDFMSFQKLYTDQLQYNLFLV